MIQKPMPLEDLKGYLNSRQMNEGNAPLVDVGRIVVPKRSYKWPMSIAAALMFVVISVGSVMTYNAMSAEHMTVVMDLNGNQSISQIVFDSGAQVLSVKKTEGSTYEVKLSTKKSRASFLEWLRNNRGVKKAELQD